MPSVRHEALVDMFRVRPQLAAELLAAVGFFSPERVVEGTLLEADLTQVMATEFRADAVLRLRGALDLVVIIEVQMRRDARKRLAWPVYLSVAHARHDCPTVLLVVVLDRATARWASTPIEVGPGFVLHPVVIGPEQVPVVTDREVARASPEIAVLSAMVHGHEPIGVEVGMAAVAATQDLDGERARLYLDLILQSLQPAARTLLESLMLPNWQPQSEFLKRLDAAAEVRGRAEGMDRGRASGQRELLLRQIRRRFGAVPEDVEARIVAATEGELGAWGEALMDADTLDAVFAGGECACVGGS